MAYPQVFSTGANHDSHYLFESTNGAHGSFSYVDVNKYGVRGYRSALLLGGSYVGSTGNRMILPGGGGGARPLPTYKRGSKSVGYSPNGIVLIRLVRIAE